MNAMTKTTATGGGHIPDGFLWFGNNLLTIPVAAGDGGDALSVIDMHSPFGDGPPLHIHTTQDEVFVVLSGRLRLVVGGRTVTLSAGQTALAPRGVAHTYRVESNDGAHFLAITHGKDFETMIRKMSRPAEHAGLPTPAQPTPAIIAALTAACAESGIEIVGPPLA